MVKGRHHEYIMNTYNRREILRLLGLGALAATGLATGCGGAGPGGNAAMQYPNPVSANPVYGLDVGFDVFPGQDPYLNTVIPASQI